MGDEKAADGAGVGAGAKSKNVRPNLYAQQYELPGGMSSE